MSISFKNSTNLGYSKTILDILLFVSSALPNTIFRIFAFSKKIGIYSSSERSINSSIYNLFGFVSNDNRFALINNSLMPSPMK